MLVKIHDSYRAVIAICDYDILGKTFEEGRRQIKVNEHFFGGEEKTEKEVLKLIEEGSAEDYTFNIVGKESVATAIKAGVVTESGIIRIQGVPIALVLL